MRGSIAVFGLAVVLVVAFPAVAWADPARPTNFQSEITEVDPPARGFDIEVVGGDAFLQLKAGPGTAVVVPGYDGEPYLRFEPDGAVWANQRSPAYWLNMDRYQDVAPPAEATSSAEPEWLEVATNGTWAWHDHRIHWMSPSLPPNVRPDTASEIFPWSVPLLVDGQRVEVIGALTWVPSHSPAPWTMAGVAIAAAVAWLCTRFSAPVPLALAAAGALTVGIAEAAITPPDAGGTTAMWLAPAAALACAVGGYVRTRARGELVVAAIVLLSVWVAPRLPAVVMPILPSPLPTSLQRGIVVTVLAIAVGVMVSLLRRRLHQPSTE